MSNLQATNYGKCIVADYQATQKDMCKKEFMALKDCYLVRVPSALLLFEGLTRRTYNIIANTSYLSRKLQRRSESLLAILLLPSTVFSAP